MALVCKFGGEMSQAWRRSQVVLGGGGCLALCDLGGVPAPSGDLWDLQVPGMLVPAEISVLAPPLPGTQIALNAGFLAQPLPRSPSIAAHIG